MGGLAELSYDSIEGSGQPGSLSGSRLVPPPRQFRARDGSLALASLRVAAAPRAST
jgi:hypothetical protein